MSERMQKIQQLLGNKAAAEENNPQLKQHLTAVIQVKREKKPMSTLIHSCCEQRCAQLDAGGCRAGQYACYGLFCVLLDIKKA